MSKVYMIPHYPVGSILEFDRAMDMKSIYGGTWELFGAGRMTICIKEGTRFNQVRNEGGSESHVQTIGEMPIHAHAVGGVNNGVAATPEVGSYPVAIAQDLKFNWLVPDSMMTGAGGSQPMDIMNPYTVVYRYRKVAD